MTTSGAGRIPATHLALALASPLTFGALLAIRIQDVAPVLAVPAIIFGVVAATCPALAIGIAITDRTPTLATLARAIAGSLAAFGVALGGFILPAVFISLTSLTVSATLVCASCAVGGAAAIGVARLRNDLALRAPLARVVLGVWVVACAIIGARLWLDLMNQAVRGC